MDYVKNNMKGRAYRRYMEEVKVISRLKGKEGRRYRIKDADDVWVENYRWIDMIGTHDEWVSKTLTTTRSDTSYKLKWGLKGKKRKYADSSNPWTRVKDKERYKRDLEHEGYKHLPSYPQSESELDSSERDDILSEIV